MLAQSKGSNIVEFEDSEARVKVVEAGPWYFDYKPLLLSHGPLR